MRGIDARLEDLERSYIAQTDDAQNRNARVLGVAVRHLGKTAHVCKAHESTCVEVCLHAADLSDVHVIFIFFNHGEFRAILRTVRRSQLAQNP